MKQDSINFINFQNFNGAYDTLIQKIIVVIYKVAHIEERRINQEWLIVKLLKNFKIVVNYYYYYHFCYRNHKLNIEIMKSKPNHIIRLNKDQVVDFQ